MKNRYWIGFYLLILMLVITGCQSKEVQNIQEVESPLTVVETSVVFEDQVEDYYMSFGEVVPQNQVDLFLNGTGEIDSILVNAGDQVSVDTPLIKLSKDQVVTTYNAQESQLRTIRDNLKTQLDSNRDNYQKQFELLQSGYVTQSSIDALQTQLETLEKQYLDAANNYNNQVKNLKRAVDDRVLTSTISGEVAGIYVKQGQSVANQKAITIINRDETYIKTMVTSALLETLNLGTKAIIHLSNDQSDVLQGEISNIELVPDLKSKLYAVEIKINENTDSLYIGDFVEVKFITDEHMATLVPNAAVLYEGSKTFIFLLEDETAVKIPVKLGLTKGENIEIVTSESVVGKQIIVRGQSYIQDGEIVALKN